jgi:3',5'-cyclic AMP phosphodiesterase CpdA
MFTLAHLSDVHLAPLPPARVLDLLNKRFFGYINWQSRKEHHRRDVLDPLVEDLLQQGADHIAITGDLTNIGLPEEFVRAMDWLMEVGHPGQVTIIPGNHDAYTPLIGDPGFWRWEVYMQSNPAGARYAATPPAGFPFLRIFDDVALIGLSTAVPTLPAMATGYLGKRQLKALASLLERLGEDHFARVVLIHHPPLPGMTGPLRGLQDAVALREVLRCHGAELVIYGHTHRFKTGKLDTPRGPVLIAGAPSASLAAHHPERMARYSLFTLAALGNGRWEIGLRSRVFDQHGKVEEIDHGMLI